MTVKVKICGVCSVADARAAVAAGADYLGLNFHPASPRCLDEARAVEIAAAVPGTPLVGVFVDAPRDRVVALGRAIGFAALQFHGDEDPDYCRGWDRPVIKALRPRSAGEAVTLAGRYGCEYVLVDSWVPGVAGGSGAPLDLDHVEGIERARLFLAGGLRPETVAAAVRRVRPYAVDVASGVEVRPGEKDHAKVEAFIRRAKAA